MKWILLVLVVFSAPLHAEEGKKEKGNEDILKVDIIVFPGEMNIRIDGCHELLISDHVILGMHVLPPKKGSRSTQSSVLMKVWRIDVSKRDLKNDGAAFLTVDTDWLWRTVVTIGMPKSMSLEYTRKIGD